MAQQPKSGGRRLTLAVSTAQRPDFKEPIVAYLFDAGGTFLQSAEIVGGKLDVALPGDSVRPPRLVIAPVVRDADAEEVPNLERLLKLGAYEPVLRQAGKLIDRIFVPGPIIDIWPFCFCWVHGRVVRAGDNRAVCKARVHICEVDRIPIWILRLRDAEVFRLRDDLVRALATPSIPIPPPEPDPIRGLAARRFGDLASRVAFNPQPDPPVQAKPALRFSDKVSLVALNPQPLPPKDLAALPLELHTHLRSTSATTVRRALAANWTLLVPWLCIWPHWWWWFRCDEIATVETDAYGHFERLIVYPCHGDHPDLYFWVEYDFGAGFESVYRPSIACHTHWNYVCGSEVTIRVTDPRVPGCEEEPDLPGKQVVVLSIGPGIAVREVAATGLTNFGEPFGATLEPRVDFSRSALIGSGVPYYRWSYTRLSAPDGSGVAIDPASPPIGVPTPMRRDVYRHYKDGTSYPSERMGPLPTSGPGAAPNADLFKIRPVASPSGDEWVVLNESVDLATAYFDSASLSGNPVYSPVAGWSEDLAAGLYELKLELFDAAGNLVDFTAKGIDLRIADQDAPFGTGTLATVAAPSGNRILSGANTVGFRMTVRVDNNRCFAEIGAVGGTVTPDADCGFHNYGSPSDTAGLNFVARHPHKFASYHFGTGRGTGGEIAVATTSGTAGEADSNGFGSGAGFAYAKGVAVSDVIGPCPNAAFWERLDVYAMVTNGYGALSGYNAADNAAFALAKPCPEHPGGGHGGHGG